MNSPINYDDLLIYLSQKPESYKVMLSLMGLLYDEEKFT